MKRYSCLLAAFTAILLGPTGRASAETWNLATGAGFWSDSTAWVEGTFPNAVGATATFNNPTGTRTVNLNDGSNGPACPGSACNFTIGTLNFTTNSASATTIRNDTSGTNNGTASLI